MYTYYGDANLDGQVTTADFTQVSANFAQTGKIWVSGDFNYDGVIMRWTSTRWRRTSARRR